MTWSSRQRTSRPRGIARMSRRHKLGSEASARFERGVDPELPLRASARAAMMLATLGGGTVVPGCSIAAAEIEPVTVAMEADYPDQVAGLVYGGTVLSGSARSAAPSCTCRVRQRIRQWVRRAPGEAVPDQESSAQAPGQRRWRAGRRVCLSATWTVRTSRAARPGVTGITTTDATTGPA